MYVSIEREYIILEVDIIKKERKAKKAKRNKMK